ncbi:SGNH hydrolase-type esterase domain-containing protein [Aspergillus tamarii]|uniref:SGNH hydrolase-type esterase domain-containing protein n=1 Tax=Aspergillus tamarii TaxID=41984 RepID=A0A5N6UCG8_ASPTM|nr:SGNH hydrolase-type esterase domain-containing protein [Aspergillus tamarii]
MAALVMLLLALSLLMGPFGGFALSGNASQSLDYTISPRGENLARGDPRRDPADMHWITKWGAIGDSFTAGIGAGRLWDTSPEVRKCSRYDQSYVVMLERALGISALKFQWLACSGAKSKEILEQAKKLDNDMDLVVLTAGGNDLCLIDVLKDCIFLAYNEKSCDSAIKRAKLNAEYILEPALESILVELEKHMKPNTGIVVFVSYAQFFHDIETASDDCAKYNNWAFPAIGGPFNSLPVDLKRRKEYNELVRITNAGIGRSIDKMRERGVKYRLRFANWDDWASDERVAGQFCWPGSTGEYPDPEQPNLQFFKPDTKKKSLHDEVKKRNTAVNKGPLEPEVSYGANGSRYNSPNPAAEAIHMLNGGDPAPRDDHGCTAFLDKRSWGSELPNRWGKWFHPNERGHLTIASFVLNEVISARASILEVENPLCKDEDRDHFHCRGNKGDTLSHYVQSHLADKTYQTYCNEVQPPEHANWQDERVFYKGTPEEHKYSISLTKGATQFSKQECLNSFMRIIHGCDLYRPENPLNLKHGGSWKKGRYTYELKIGHIRRPWPIARPEGSCEGWYKVLFSRYTIRGRLWASLDHGQELRNSAKKCVGGGLTSWSFKYFDRPDRNDMEWEAQFSTPIWVQKRCFENSKVFLNIGGPRMGCQGNDNPWPFNW